MPWPWRCSDRPDAHPRDEEWTETEHRQREGLRREARERRAVEARITAILHEFEALADPRLIRRLRDL